MMLIYKKGGYLMGKNITHMVIFTLKHERGSKEEEEFLNCGEKTLSSIPFVKNFKVLKQVSVKNQFDFGFSMDFVDQGDYNSYNNHPDHLSFVKDRWENEVDKFLEIDLETL